MEKVVSLKKSSDTSLQTFVGQGMKYSTSISGVPSLCSTANARVFSFMNQSLLPCANRTHDLTALDSRSH